MIKNTLRKKLKQTIILGRNGERQKYKEEIKRTREQIINKMN